MKVIVVTSGKGGVGKTTTSAAFASGLALRGFKTAVIDFDVGLRNLDLIMGCERRVVYDFVNVLNGEARLNQALIKDKHCENLFVLPASQTRDKDALTEAGVGNVLKELEHLGFEYVVCDSPAGIEHGAVMALTFADEAIITTNPEVSSFCGYFGWTECAPHTTCTCNWSFFGLFCLNWGCAADGAAAEL